MSREPWMLCARHLLHVPGLLVLHHGMENRHKRAHAGRQRDLLGFARSAQALVKGCEPRMSADGHERTPVEGRTPMCAPTPGRASPSSGATVPVERGNPDEGCEALAASGPQRREVEPQRPRTARPPAWDAAV